MFDGQCVRFNKNELRDLVVLIIRAIDYTYLLPFVYTLVMAFHTTCVRMTPIDHDAFHRIIKIINGFPVDFEFQYVDSIFGQSIPKRLNFESRDGNYYRVAYHGSTEIRNIGRQTLHDYITPFIRDEVSSVWSDQLHQNHFGLQNITHMRIIDKIRLAKVPPMIIRDIAEYLWAIGCDNFVDTNSEQFGKLTLISA